MQDLLKRIIEMDEQARKIEQQAKNEKLRSETEVEQLKEQIYNDYIVRAKDRVEKNIAVDRENADKRYAQAQQHSEEMKQEMNRLYQQNKDSWVEEIVKRAIN
jgi:transposase